jgi:hypothetical protein
MHATCSLWSKSLDRFGSQSMSMRPGNNELLRIPRRSLELNNKGHYPFIQPLCSEVQRASRLRFSHSIDAPLNFLRFEAHNSKHLDPEALMAPFVQMLQTARYTLDSSGCEVHISGSRRPTL